MSGTVDLRDIITAEFIANHNGASIIDKTFASILQAHKYMTELVEQPSCDNEHVLRVLRECEPIIAANSATDPRPIAAYLGPAQLYNVVALIILHEAFMYADAKTQLAV